MSAKPLTKAEAAWIKKLEKLFQACPSDRLACYTIGDPSLTFFDKNVYAKHEEALGRDARDVPYIASESGAEFEMIWTGVGIVSAAG